MTAPQDSGVRLYTVSAFKHLQSRSIFYRPRVSRQELLDALYEVLPQADVVSIRRVDPAEEEDPITKNQKWKIDRLVKEKNIDPPKGYPNISKREASAWITNAVAKRQPPQAPSGGEDDIEAQREWGVPA